MKNADYGLCTFIREINLIVQKRLPAICSAMFLAQPILGRAGCISVDAKEKHSLAHSPNDLFFARSRAPLQHALDCLIADCFERGRCPTALREVGCKLFRGHLHRVYFDAKNGNGRVLLGAEFTRHIALRRWRSYIHLHFSTQQPFSCCCI